MTSVLAGNPVFTNYGPYNPGAPGHPSQYGNGGTPVECNRIVTVCDNPDQAGTLNTCCDDIASITITWGPMVATWNPTDGWGDDEDNFHPGRLRKRSDESCTFYRRNSYGTDAIKLVGRLSMFENYGYGAVPTCVDGDMQFSFYAAIQDSSGLASRFCFDSVIFYEYSNGSLTATPRTLLRCDAQTCEDFKTTYFPDAPVVTVDYAPGSPCGQKCATTTIEYAVDPIVTYPNPDLSGLWPWIGLGAGAAPVATEQMKFLYLEHLIKSGNLNGKPEEFLSMLRDIVFNENGMDAKIMPLDEFLRTYPQHGKARYNSYVKFFEGIKERYQKGSSRFLDAFIKNLQRNPKKYNFSFCREIAKTNPSLKQAMKKLGVWGIVLAIIYGSMSDSEADLIDIEDLFLPYSSTLGDSDIPIDCDPIYICPPTPDNKNNDPDIYPTIPWIDLDGNINRRGNVISAPRPSFPANMMDQGSLRINNQILASNHGFVNTNNTITVLRRRL